MGFGAIITSGDNNTPIGDSLSQWLVEVRVEQELSQPTRFAIRFEEDLCEGEPTVVNQSELQAGTVIAVVVPDGDGQRCLVRGPITRIRTSAALGGPGSWVQVEGESRLVEMGRVCVQTVWQGLASDAVSAILASYGFIPDVEETTKVYSDQGDLLNQREDDLAFVEKMAQENNFEFWLDYEVEEAPGGVPAGPAPVVITELARFKSSPSRSGSPAGGSAPAGLTLAPTSELAMRVHVSGELCPNVTAFDVEVDAEQPNAAAGVAVDDQTGQVAGTQSTDPQPSSESGGTRLAELDGVTRTVCVTGAGGAQDLQSRQEAALTEAGWYITATSSTTSHMLGGVLVPHDIIPVQGLGNRFSGPYQVKSTVHVINAVAHYMDHTLRSNTQGQA